jgi:hypothetical protein
MEGFAVSDIEAAAFEPDPAQLPKPAVPIAATVMPPSASPPAGTANLSLQMRADRLMVRTIPMLRYRLRRFGWGGVAGGAFLLVAAVLGFVFVLPARQSINALGHELLTTTTTAPLPASATLSPQQFSGSLPSRGQVPALLNTVLEQAHQAGITLEQGKYSFLPAAGSRLARYSFEFPIKADYAHIRGFINNSLSAIPALGLEKLHIERKNVGDVTVSADVGFVIYLRSSGQ